MASIRMCHAVGYVIGRMRTETPMHRSSLNGEHGLREERKQSVYTNFSVASKDVFKFKLRTSNDMSNFN
jgi:hypothetical protein